MRVMCDESQLMFADSENLFSHIAITVLSALHLQEPNELCVGMHLMKLN